MSGLTGSELLFYGGLAGMVVVLLGAVIAVILFWSKGKKLKKDIGGGIRRAMSQVIAGIYEIDRPIGAGGCRNRISWMASAFEQAGSTESRPADACGKTGVAAQGS